MSYKQEPDYGLVQEYITRAAENYNITLDRNLDWTEKPKLNSETKSEISKEVIDKQAQQQMLLKPPIILSNQR